MAVRLCRKCTYLNAFLLTKYFTLLTTFYLLRLTLGAQFVCFWSGVHLILSSTLKYYLHFTAFRSPSKSNIRSLIFVITAEYIIVPKCKQDPSQL